MPVISIPMFCRVRTAVSRPEPVPETIDVELADAMLAGPAGSFLGRDLSGIRSRLARSLESNRAAGGPDNRVAALIGDSDERVVERGLDMGLAVSDVLALAPTDPLLSWGRSGRCLVFVPS